MLTPSATRCVISYFTPSFELHLKILRWFLQPVSGRLSALSSLSRSLVFALFFHVVAISAVVHLPVSSHFSQFPHLQVPPPPVTAQYVVIYAANDAAPSRSRNFSSSKIYTRYQYAHINSIRGCLPSTAARVKLVLM